MMTKDIFAIGILSTLLATLVAMVQPYKSKAYNRVDVLLILSMGLTYIGAVTAFTAFLESPDAKPAGVFMVLVPFSMPFLYFVVYVTYKCFRKMYFAISQQEESNKSNIL